MRTREAWDDLIRQAEAVLDAVGIGADEVVRYLAPEVLGIPVCRECGCTPWTPCEGGCYWVDADLCSACTAEGEEVSTDEP